GIPFAGRDSLCRTGFPLPDGIPFAGRDLQSRPKCLSITDNESCRTRFPLPDGIPFAGRDLQSRPKCLPVTDNESFCNPVRNVLSVPGSISFGRGCKPRPATEGKKF
ncbi:MAG: hypothetical protein DRI57_21440, partial [Deltaproteobacteria bacterium]